MQKYLAEDGVALPPRAPLRRGTRPQTRPTAVVTAGHERGGAGVGHPDLACGLMEDSRYYVFVDPSRALPRSWSAPRRRREIARSAGELGGRDGLSAAVPTSDCVEENLASASCAPQRLAVFLVRVRSDNRRRIMLLDETPHSRRSANARDDAHGFSVVDVHSRITLT